MRFEDVRFSRDPHEKRVNVEVEPGLLIVRREGIAKWIVTTVFAGLTAAFLWLVCDIGKPQTVEAVVSWKGLLTAIVFIAMFLVTADLSRCSRLHLEYRRERYVGMACESFAVALGVAAIAEHVRGEAAPGGKVYSTFGLMVKEADRALRLTREERAGVLEAVRELGAQEAAEVKREWDERGLDTIEEQGAFIRERYVSDVAQACLMLEDQSADFKLYRRNKRSWRARDFMSVPMLIFHSPADANECSTIYNSPRTDSPAADSP